LPHGWPREEWLPRARFDDNTVAIPGQLANTVVPKHPNATVEFKSVTFLIPAISGPLRKVLPPKPKEEAEAE